MGEGFSALRDVTVAFLRDHGAGYELCPQLCTDPGKMPVEDASVGWPEEESPLRPVTRLAFPPQDAYGPARRVHLDGALAFSPARTRWPRTGRWARSCARGGSHGASTGSRTDGAAGQSPSGSPTTATSGSPANSRAETRRTSSRVTASIRPLRRSR